MKDNNILLGKIPPQAIECEVGVIGASLLERETFETLMDIILAPEYFYDLNHQAIWKAMFETYVSGRQVDLITITEAMRTNGTLDAVGGAYGLVQITLNIVSSAHAFTHARIVAEKFILREIIRISGDAIQRAYQEEDCFDLQENTITTLSGIYEANSQTLEHISEPLKRALTDIHDAAKTPDFTLGLPSGLKELDKVTNGFQKKNLVIIAARPGQGKTSLAGNFVLNVAKQGHAVGFISLEMSKDEITKRLIACESSIDLNNINHGRIDKMDRLTDIIHKIAALPIYFEDKPSISLLGIKSLIRRLIKKNSVKLIVVDYLQLIKPMKSFNKNRAEIVSEIARGLKEIAKEYSIPIIALAQLNRQVDKQSNKKPVLSDLAESGGIEANADQVIFIYHSEGTQLVVAKNRGGRVDDVGVKFIPSLQRWSDLSEPIPATFESYKMPVEVVSNNYMKPDNAPF